MASLVSPGVSVTVIDESFYIPAAAPTVPLFFIATRANKLQPDGLTPAAYTSENGVVRTITSIGQSVQGYGIPYFWKDNAGNEFHGDARNEYGLLALNQALAVINRAYVVRANVDLTDSLAPFVGTTAGPVIGGGFNLDGTGEFVPAGAAAIVGIGNGSLTAASVPAVSVKPQTVSVVFTSSTTFNVAGSVSGALGSGTVGVAFTSAVANFTITQGTTAWAIDDILRFQVGYQRTAQTGTGNGKMNGLTPDPTMTTTSAGAGDLWTITFTSATTFNVSGSTQGAQPAGTVGVAYDNGKINFRIVSGGTAFVAGDTMTVQFTTITPSASPLGANDAAKRTSIVTALAAAINGNTDVRGEAIEYNLIVCPGYHELVDEMQALSLAINEEAFVIADTPSNQTPDQTATWSLTTARKNGSNIAYYYPWGLKSNLDGRNVVCAPSGMALQVYGYSDSQGYVWDAPAGARRGLVVGVDSVGYITGTLGTATTFVEANLNPGQRDNLYQFYNNINPIVYFPGRGILVWGQKTSATAASAMDRVNVVRLVMYLKRALRKGSFSFIFEPNDKITRDDYKAAADGILGDVMAKRGLYDFATLCDESNNTPSRIDNNEMYLDVAIKPTKTAEFLYVIMRVLSTGAEMPG